MIGGRNDRVKAPAAFMVVCLFVFKRINLKRMIQDFADWLVYGLFGLSADTSLGVAVNFFFYDTIKILILLFSLVC